MTELTRVTRCASLRVLAAQNARRVPTNVLADGHYRLDIMDRPTLALGNQALVLNRDSRER